MAIYKANVDSNYTVIPNSTAKDKRITFEARGMLSLLLSLPPDWQVNNSWLISQSAAGRDKVNSILRELIEFGYMTRQQPKNQHGKFTSNDYFVYASPVDGFAVYGETVDGLPVNGETPTTKERSLETKEISNFGVEIEDAFKVFYNAGMRKLNPKGALKSFTALCKKQKKQQTPMDIANHLVNDIKIRLANNQMGFDKMHPTTYLNGERWNDERLQESNATANSQGRNADPMAAVNAAIARREQQRNNQRDEQAGLAMENGGRTLPHKMD